MKFTKMQAAGNDFILVNGLEKQKDDWNEFARKVCDRHFGIGADGLMFCSESKIGDIKMNYYNSDGSRGEMCGNGIRCFSKFVYDNKIIDKKQFLVETDAGLKTLSLEIDENGKANYITVNMGKTNFKASSIAKIKDSETILNRKVIVDKKEVIISSALMGVPHTVIFVDDFSKYNINYLGSKIEKLEIFKNNTNVNFVKKIDEKTLEIKTWERGAGRTLGCGTGCCAAAAIAKRLGIVNENKILMKAEGGQIQVEIKDDYSIIMSGKAEKICTGDI
ncbi:diaminopimelate epimerase [uncultured Fusobacterium sp.]|uniref:diaminopimelate epimerase n=1 Tax=uncultured Fusobacterium sp. TaxID=159267 RepID=UPI0025F12EC4|nr:diaminopimelate epimerase [uncultured Fusobacterium sp.]